TAIMHYGFRIVEDMIDGLSDYLDSKGLKSVMDLVGKAVPSLQKWETLDLHYKRVARINYDNCIGCNLCYIACEDGAHQCIDLIPHNGVQQPVVRQADCVGCALCFIVCPVESCISMTRKDDGSEAVTWNQLMKQLPQPLAWESLR